MSRRFLFLSIVILVTVSLVSPLVAVEHPAAHISSNLIDVEVYLPDPENGYYRGTRFDWSGAISSLTYAGHQYFGEWQESEDPYLHDRITGPVEEYRTAEKGLGYDEAEVGGRFLRIGVGVCEKPEEEDYRWRHTYRVVDPGEWTIRRGANWIEFAQAVQDPGSGYGYRLVKRLTLTPSRPELVVDHTLENIGTKRIETNVYNHNFFVVDSQPTGPDFRVRFPFELTADRDLRGLAKLDGDSLVYPKAVPQGQSVITLLTGYGSTAADHAFSIENAKVGAGVRMHTDKPLSKLQYWSPHTTLCPEPFLDLELDPGQADRWTTRYEFYTLD